MVTNRVRSRKFIFVVLLIACLIGVDGLGAQQPRVQQQAWVARQARFEAIQKEPRGNLDQTAKAELLTMLKLENQEVRDFSIADWGKKSVAEKFGGQYWGYYNDLLELVFSYADLRNPDTLTTIAFSVYGVPSNVARKVAAQKESALPIVEDLLKSQLFLDRERGAGILALMIADPSLSCETGKKVSERIFSLVYDKENKVRYQAMNGLGAMRDSRSVSLLKQIAESYRDPATRVEGPDGIAMYPVPEAAQRHLGEIEKSGGVRDNPCAQKLNPT
jgi:hypothetical protein